MKSLKNFKFNRSGIARVGFTLAEVLITLGIIGVVAAMVIPTLISSQQDRATVTSLKKTHSILSQAFKLAVNENGTPDTWNLGGWTSDTGANNAMDIFVNYLKIIKRCDVHVSGCMATDYDYLDNSGSDAGINHWVTAQLNDGTMIGILTRSADCTYISNICADFEVDINGLKKPNVFGKDYFRFWITKTGVVPKGLPNDSYAFSSSCIVGNGESCAAWAIYNENLDYLKCPSSLSWAGNRTCP